MDPPAGAVFPQRGQATRLLNHSSDILSFQVTRGLASGGESQRGTVLRVTRMSFHRETKAFPVKIEKTAVINESSSTSVDVVDCASVVDVTVGLTVPCLLLKQRKKKWAHFKYLLVTLSHSNSLSPHLEFKVPYEIKDNLTFLQGPTMLWSNAGVVYYTSKQVGEVKQVPLHLSSVSFIGELPLDRRKIIIFGSQISSKERPVDAQEGVWGQRNRGYFLEEGKEFDGAWVLPHAYSSVVKCVYLISAEEDENGLRSAVVAATGGKQLVWFEDGAPRDVCVLPFEEPQNVLMVDTGRNGCLFAISFSHGNVCTVWKDSFQVASCWQGVCSLLVDDFVGCGTDQALMLFDDPPGVAPTNFIITDLGDITYTSRPESSEGLHGADTVQENHLLTVQALESRLQSGMASIQDLQRDLEEKERVILQSVRALTALVSGGEHALPSAQQEHLVSLWDDDDEDEEGLDEELRAPPLAPPTLVEKVWHRVIEDSLVVGVQLTADAASMLESASISFLIEAGPGPGPAPPIIQVLSRSFRFPQRPALLPAALSGLEPPAKRKKPEPTDGAGLSKEPECLTVTAVSELAPLLACAALPCRVLLHLPTAPWRAGGPTAMHCGFVSLDIQDVAQGKLAPRLLNDRTLTTAEAGEDLLSLLAASDSWCFQIGCSDHTLFDVPQWLLGALGCERAAVRPDFILSDPERLPASMVFQWQERTAFRGELVVYCRGLHRLLQFLDSLCRCLPSSHWLHPLGRGRAEQDPAQALASSLEREALALREGVASLLHRATDGEESEGKGRAEGTTDPPTTVSDPTGSAPTDAADELQRRREEWGRERERSGRRLRPLVDVERYRGLTAALSHVQLETDLAALALCEAWPFPAAPSPDSPLPAAPNRHC
ncbi:hypothetical protein SKAU_G00258230 [Synaphobranchus kaupii]|uniref:Fanconi anemia group B protein n=1 Tax=Synaphobranchus kaupii TaxID=118154 RepID=A0A9Q1ISA3_SYNKA|nr:hypothetical protein SKAU_G00258230 [Synaphobranchus kaupii]